MKLSGERVLEWIGKFKEMNGVLPKSEEIVAQLEIASEDESRLYTDTMWSLDDVMDRYHCDEEEAWDVLNYAVGGAGTHQAVWETIEDRAYELKLEPKKYD